LEGSQYLLDLRYRAQENSVVQVPPVQGPNLGQGVQGCLDARRKEEGAQGVTLLHPPGRPDDLPANQQGGRLERLPHPWHHGWAQSFDGFQDGRPCDGVEGAPLCERRLERGKGGGGIPSLGGRQQPLCQQPAQGVAHRDQAHTPVLLAQRYEARRTAVGGRPGGAVVRCWSR